jgi:hypothetical protein
MIGLLGVKVGWEVGPDRSVEYVIQLDADDLEQFRVERVIRSDVPSQMKNIRSYRIEYGMGRLPPRQDPLPKEEPSTRGSVSPPSDVGRRGPPQSPWVYGRGVGSGGSATPDFLMRPEDKKAAGSKTGPSARGAGTADKSGKQAEGGPQGAETPQPWVSLVVGVALCGSLVGNLYLAWLMSETRRRYRRLVERHRKERGNDEGRMTNDEGTPDTQ